MSVARTATPAKPKSPVGSRRKTLELADIIRQHGASFLGTVNVARRHRKVMQQIVNCRTEILGGHRYRCARCEYQRYVYHSCRNRHCPKCQTSAKERWRQARQNELLPVPYFHNVFTIPHEFNGLFLKSENNQRALLNLLFASASSTLLEFGKQTFGGQIGFTMVLHTWDQQLRPHFHLHCLIPSGALVKEGEAWRWVAGGAKFLFPVRGLSVVFRAKFLAGARQLLSENLLDLTESFGSPVKQRQQIRKLFKKSWVVYSKPPFAGPKKLLDYLSRYTHRVALTNSRLVGLRDGQVTFSWRDRRDGDRRKKMALPAETLIGRFLQHVLPEGLMRIRHYGFLANRFRKVRLQTIAALLGVDSKSAPQQQEPEWLTEWLESIVGPKPEACPCCGERLLHTESPSRLPAITLTRKAMIRGSP